MSQYALLREDLDNLLEVTQWPNSVDPMKCIESKVKAAFTRSYNKDVVLPYATSLGSISKRWIFFVRPYRLYPPLKERDHGGLHSKEVAYLLLSSHPSSPGFDSRRSQEFFSSCCRDLLMALLRTVDIGYLVAS